MHRFVTFCFVVLTAGLAAGVACSVDSKEDGLAPACADSDLDCVLDHLVFTEGGKAVPLVTVPSAALSPAPADYPPRAFAIGPRAESDGSGDGSPALWGFVGNRWTVLQKTTALFRASLAAAPDGTLFVVDDDTLWKWDGAKLVSTGCALAGKTGILTVAALGASDAWFGAWDSVSYGGTPRPVVVHWDGSRCDQRLVDPKSAHAIQAIWAQSDNHVWATDGIAAYRFDGSGWSEVPGSRTGYCCYTGIWGSSPNDVWLTGQRLRHWNGSGFADTASPVGSLSAIHGSAANDVWAVAGGMAGAAIHFDGVAWSQLAAFPFVAQSVWTGSRKDAWALGAGGFTSAHWDGTAWTRFELSRNVSTPLNLGALGTDSRSPTIAARHDTDIALKPPPTLILSSGSGASDRGGGPAGTARLVLEPSCPPQVLDLSWTDLSGAQPSFCFSYCDPRRTARCAGHFRCSRGGWDGRTTGANHYVVGYSAARGLLNLEGQLSVTPVIGAGGADPTSDLASGKKGSVPPGIGPKGTIDIEIKGGRSGCRSGGGGGSGSGSGGGDGGGDGGGGGSCMACISGQPCAACGAGAIACGTKTCCPSGGTCSGGSCRTSSTSGFGPVTIQKCGATPKYTSKCAQGGCCPTCMTCNPDGTCNLPR